MSAVSYALTPADQARRHLAAKWRRRLWAEEDRIRDLIAGHRADGEQGAAVLAEWDRRRGQHWDQSEPEAMYVVLECLPILETPPAVPART